MPIRSKSEAEKVFAPFVDQIVSIIEEAHAHFIEKAGGLLHVLEPRTKAGMVRDIIVFRLRAWADETPGVQFFRSGNLGWFGFKNNWIARVKLLDDRFNVGVSPTSASEQYNRNDIPESIRSTLLDEKEATLLYLGWRTTENAPVTPEVALVCNNSFGEPHWIWPLKGSEPPPPLPLVTPDTPDGGDGGPQRIRIKAKPQRKEA